MAKRYEFMILTKWNNTSINHDPIHVTLGGQEDVINLSVKGPFFNDPPNPRGTRGEPFPQLWDHEVVEAFFLNDKDEYLEVELCPHGQHLVLLLQGRRNIVKEQLPLKYEATIDSDSNTWTGTAYIPATYFPPAVTKFNSYAIHGSGDNRTYEALYPATFAKHSQPDFHRLEFFQPLAFSNLLPSNKTAVLSDIWTKS